MDALAIELVTAILQRVDDRFPCMRVCVLWHDIANRMVVPLVTESDIAAAYHRRDLVSLIRSGNLTPAGVHKYKFAYDRDIVRAVSSPNRGLVFAVISGYNEMINPMVVKGATNFNEALFHAANDGNIAAVEMLINLGADDFRTALSCARFRSQHAAVEVIRTRARERNYARDHAHTHNRPHSRNSSWSRTSLPTRSGSSSPEIRPRNYTI